MVSIVIGTVAFFLIIGQSRLRPNQIDWLYSGGWGDTWKDYLGWVHFRNTPWGFPIGLNPNNGLEVSSSIVYSDSIPIASIIFKALSPVLPPTFQYFGLWILISLILQTLFALKLFELLINSKTVQILASVLFCCSPILIHRANVHISLTSHWLILAALYLALKGSANRNFNYWILLIVVSAGVQPYFLAINLFFFGLAILIGILREEILFQNLKWEALKLSVIPLALWQYGYFEIPMSSQSTDFPYDLWRVDLLQPINFAGWSHLASIWGFTEIQGNYEAFNYLGPGIILLCIFLGIGIVISPIKFFKAFNRNLTIGIPVLVMALYSLTNKVSLGRRQLVTFAVPEWCEPVTTSFRAAGRFFWPLYYLVSIYAVVYICRKLSSKNLSIALFSILTLIHLIDTHYAWGKIANQRYGNLNSLETKIPKLDEEAWNELLYSKTAIKVIPNYATGFQWQKIGLISSTRGIATNSVYLARINQDQMLSVSNEDIRKLKKRELTSNTAYVVTPELKRELILNFGYTQEEFVTLDDLILVSPKSYDPQMKKRLNRS